MDVWPDNPLVDILIDLVLNSGSLHPTQAFIDPLDDLAITEVLNDRMETHQPLQGNIDSPLLCLPEGSEEDLEGHIVGLDIAILPERA